MIEKIFIPTYGRVGKQKTYHSLPKKYQKKTYLVIRIEELDLHKDIPDENLIILNDEISNIAQTREAIAYLAGTIRYAVLDDDLGFKIRFRNIWTNRDRQSRHKEVCEMEQPESYVKKHPEDAGKGWWKYYDMTQQDFDDLFNMIDGWFNTGITLAGMRMSSLAMPPYPTVENSNCHGVMFYNGELLPTKKLDWTKYEVCEDVYVNMQLLEMGYRNRVTNEYCYEVKPLTYDAPEGCNKAGRTIKRNNEIIRELEKRWPGYIKVTKNTNKKKRTQGDVEELKFSCEYSRFYNDKNNKMII